MEKMDQLSRLRAMTHKVRRGTSIALSGLSVAASTPVKLYHDERGILYITAGTASLISYRSAASADELIAQPGINDVSFTASTACTVSISVRGRYR